LLSPLVSAQLVFGPNCSGKSTYLRQIGVICVLAQIGSYVPATVRPQTRSQLQYAQLPLLERLFVRMGNEESTEEQRSSFAGELEDVKAMCEGAAVPTLCLLDEFGKRSDFSLSFPQHVGRVGDGALLVAHGIPQSPASHLHVADDAPPPRRRSDTLPRSSRSWASPTPASR